MKRHIIKLLFLVPFLLTVSACKDPQAELYSYVTYDDLQKSTDPDVLTVLRKGAYSALYGTWGAHNSLWSMHEIASDELVITQKGADWQDGGQWIRMHQHGMLPTEESVNNGWTYAYTAIAKLNLLISQFGGLESFAAELRITRSLVYLWLIDAYGNVPYITETDTDAQPANITRAELFDKIEADVLASYDAVQDGPTYASSNKDVANAILAKLYLNAEVYTGKARWADAAARCDSIISSGHYSLASNFLSNFVTDNASSTENIFVIPYDAVSAQGFNMACMTLHYASQATYDLQDQPWNGYATQEEFYNSFENGDARLGSFLVGPQYAADGTTRLTDPNAEATDPDGPPLTYTPEINELYPNSLRQAGARVGKWEFAMGAAQSLSNDYPIFRYADILLMRAEALWRQSSGSAEALDLVNQVRTRAGVAALTGLDADALLAERGRELFAEGYRRSDLIRFGKFNQAWWEKDASDPSKKLFPLPLTQLQANPNLTQNPGYPSL